MCAHEVHKHWWEGFTCAANGAEEDSPPEFRSEGCGKLRRTIPALSETRSLREGGLIDVVGNDPQSSERDSLRRGFPGHGTGLHVHSRRCRALVKPNSFVPGEHRGSDRDKPVDGVPSPLSSARVLKQSGQVGIAGMSVVYIIPEHRFRHHDEVSGPQPGNQSARSAHAEQRVRFHVQVADCMSRSLDSHTTPNHVNHATLEKGVSIDRFAATRALPYLDALEKRIGFHSHGKNETEHCEDLSFHSPEGWRNLGSGNPPPYVITSG
jgi:hypothetical protein